MTKNDGGPAYPVDDYPTSLGGQYIKHLGMTLRDAIAIAALPAAIEQNVQLYEMTKRSGCNVGITHHKFVAMMSYLYADAMLAERDKK